MDIENWNFEEYKKENHLLLKKWIKSLGHPFIILRKKLLRNVLEAV